jgi:hypothetical protein
VCGRKRKSRKEDAVAAAASDLAAAEAAWAEDATLHEAIARSLEDLIPTDNAMPMDVALAWSRQDWEREEAEQQRRPRGAMPPPHNPPEEHRSSS